MGVPSRPCAIDGCVKAGSSAHRLGQGLARLSEEVVYWRALSSWPMRGVGVSQPWVTFDLCHAPPRLTLAHPNPSPLVNELEDPGAIAGIVRLAGSLSVRERLAIVWRW